MVSTEAPALESNNLTAPLGVDSALAGNYQDQDGGGSVPALSRTPARASCARNNPNQRSKRSRRQRRPDNSRSALRGPACLELRFRRQRGLRESLNGSK